MGFKRNNPGCNCCGDCTICSGNCGWTAETGSIDTVSFAPDLLIDGSNTVATCDTDAAAGTVAVRASVIVVAEAGDVVKLGIKYVDANAYWYVELTPGSTGTLKLYERSGGTSTQRGPTMPVALAGGNTYGLTICYGSGLVRATESVSGIAIPYATATSSTSGLSAFVGTGTISGAPLFSDFLYEYGYDASGHSSCTDCSCSSACAIVTNSFPGGDSSDIGYGVPSGLYELTGSWDITSGKLRCTSAGVALINTTAPCGTTAMVLEATFANSTTSSSCDFIVCANSESDYFYARYNTDGAFGSIDIRRNNGGSHSSLRSVSATINTATTYTGKVCVSDTGNITAYLDGTALVTSYGNSVSGIRAGFGASGIGTATYDSVTFSQSDRTGLTGCEVCETVALTCSDCCIATQSGITFTVEWPTAFTHISAACNGYCERLSVGDYSLSFTDTCRWDYLFTSPDCGNDCSDGQSDSPGDISCTKGGFRIDIIRDTSVSPEQCYLRLTVIVNNGGNDISPDRAFVEASYESEAGVSSDFCSGDDFTLTLKTGISSTSDTYRGSSGWYPNYSAGCNESLPSSLVIHA